MGDSFKYLWPFQNVRTFITKKYVVILLPERFFQEFTQPLQISLFFQSDGAGGVSEPKFMLESSNFEMVNSKYVRAHHMVSLIPKFSICNLFFRKK